MPNSLESQLEHLDGDSARHRRMRKRGPFQIIVLYFVVSFSVLERESHRSLLRSDLGPNALRF